MLGRKRLFTFSNFRRSVYIERGTLLLKPFYVAAARTCSYTHTHEYNVHIAQVKMIKQARVGNWKWHFKVSLHIFDFNSVNLAAFQLFSLIRSLSLSFSSLLATAVCSIVATSCSNAAMQSLNATGLYRQWINAWRTEHTLVGRWWCTAIEYSYSVNWLMTVQTNSIND